MVTSKAAHERAKIQRNMNSEEFKNYARLRNGVFRGGGDSRFLMVADVLFLWIAAAFGLFMRHSAGVIIILGIFCHEDRFGNKGYVVYLQII